MPKLETIRQAIAALQRLEAEVASEENAAAGARFVEAEWIGHAGIAQRFGLPTKEAAKKRMRRAVAKAEAAGRPLDRHTTGGLVRFRLSDVERVFGVAPDVPIVPPARPDRPRDGAAGPAVASRLQPGDLPMPDESPMPVSEVLALPWLTTGQRKAIATLDRIARVAASLSAIGRAGRVANLAAVPDGEVR